MNDSELLKLLRRVYFNLDMICKVGASHQDPHEAQARDYNRNLQRLIDADVDVSEWLIPESVIKPSYGRIDLPDGRTVQLKRVIVEEFFQRANPVMQYLADEITERSGAQAGETLMAHTPVDSSEVWVIFGRDLALKEEIF